MREKENIKGLLALSPDFIGFIFYEKSLRFAGDLEVSFAKSVHEPIQKVGVFVNASMDYMLEKANTFSLKVIQLHGDESRETVYELKKRGFTVIKVFRVMDELPGDLLNFKEADYFLFDTKAKEYGGTGHQFNWSILEEYDLSTPYLLSGGISLCDLGELKKRNLPGMIGIDVNSKFEIDPGVKNLKLIEKLKEGL